MKGREEGRKVNVKRKESEKKGRGKCIKKE